MSKAREDLPDPERPVKTMRASRGSSTETSFKLCSLAPRTINLSATADPCRLVSDFLYVGAVI